MGTFATKFLILIMMLIGSSAALQATETRVQSMGGVGGFMHDNSNIYLFPASIYRYENQLITELRLKNQVNTFTAGVHLPFGETAVGGIYLNRNLNLPVPRGLTSQVRLDQATDFLVGMKFAENNLGLRISIGLEDADHSAVDSLDFDRQETARYFEFAGGVSSNYYDFGAYFNLPSIEGVTGAVKEKWSGTGFGVSGRFFLGPANGIQYVPLVIIDQISADLEQDTVDSETDFLRVSMGIGFHYQVNANNLVILGVEVFGMESDERNTPGVGKTQTIIRRFPAFYLGGETVYKNWMLLRVGARHALEEIETSFRPAGGRKVKDSRRRANFDLFVGLGIRLGNFQVDFDINDNYLFEGPDFISGQGSDEIDDFVNRLSISYYF